MPVSLMIKIPLRMLLLPLPTPVFRQGDNIVSVILSGAKDRRAAGDAIQPNDILVLSSKALATVEGAMIDLRIMTPSSRAQDIAMATGRSPHFCEAMLRELERLNGKIIGMVPGAALTEVRPSGMITGTILIANAGLDESNVAEGLAIGWPIDPVRSVRKLRMELGKRMTGCEFRVSGYEDPATRNSQPATSIILSDSCCTPRRSGVTAIALVTSGIDPLQSQKEMIDLFGKPLKITVEAVADQLATAANFLMGNAGQSVPAVIIREHGLELSDWEGWVPGIEPEKDMFASVV